MPHREPPRAHGHEHVWADRCAGVIVDRCTGDLKLSYRRAMPDAASSSDRTWRYHFVRPGGDEIETGEFNGDEAAIARGRELSTSMQEPLVVERYGLVDWHYVDEVDERP